MAPKAKWTILTYIAAHNNLEILAKLSFDQILAVGSTPEVMQTVLFDWPGGAARYIVGGPGLVRHQEQLGDYDSADPDDLIETARWAFSRCPAEHYGLILWSHGTGWRAEEIEHAAGRTHGDTQIGAVEARDRASDPGSMAFFRSTLQTILRKDTAAERAVCFDDGTGHSLDTLELDRVTREIAASVGQPLDFLGMDACLMASIEVAYQLRSSVKYLVASEELVPAHSWPYRLILNALREDPRKSARDLAHLVVKHYTEYYTENPPPVGDVTKVALDLERIDTVVDAVNSFADALLMDFDHHAPSLWKAQHGAMQKENPGNRRKPSKFDFHLWDIGTLAAALAAQPPISDNAKRSAANLLVTLRPDGPAVVAEGHGGAWFDGIGGVTIYLVPPSKQRISPHYGDLSFATETKWLHLLRAYHEHFA